MKKTIKLLALLIALCMVLTLVFAACKPKTPPVDDDPENPNPEKPTANTFMSLNNYKAYIKSELGDYYALFDSVKSSTEVYGKVTAAYNSGLTAVDAATGVGAVQSALSSAKSAMAACIPYADDVYDLTGLDTDSKTEILGLLEAYAYRTGSSGITMFENGGYVMYSDRVTLGTENYIPGYGFGTLAEGNITGDLASESNTAWKKYYHTYNSQDPGDANYLDSQGSEVGDFYGYLSASYYTVFMNEAKNGYDWVPELAGGEVEAVGSLNAAGQATTWRFKLRTDLKYNTLSKDASRAAFNNRLVQPEDYVTAFKLLLNADNNYYRGTEMANDSGASYVVGSKEYYNATKGAGAGIPDSSYDKYLTGVQLVSEGSDTYLQITLGAPVTAWYARYYISSSLTMPIPADFIKLVGAENYLRFTKDAKTSPVDNSLSLGAYTLEKWDSDQQVVYKKNPNYVYASKYYKIEGIHINILEAAQTDVNAGFREFLAGKIDASGIPEDYLDEYVNDSRTRHTSGDATFKLNFNALDQETWIKLFGENGSVSQTPVNEYWQTKPALSNAHFRQALSYAFNRKEFAAAKGSIASLNYFSSNYMSDPENGVAYNLTDAHAKAVGNLTNENTDEGGYSLQLAREYFKMALDELEAAGKYTRGTKANPTEIKLQVAWFTSAYENYYHKYVKQYWENAFNDDSVHNGCYKLTIEFWCPASNDYNECYDAILSGTFDIGFGAISGNSMDPLSFMNVLSVDQTISHGFTLNWSVDTNDPNADLLLFNGARWSYDALYQSTQQKVQVIEGALNNTNPKLNDSSVKMDDTTGSIIASITLYKQSQVKLDAVDFVLYGYVPAKNASGYAYDEWLINQYASSPVVNADGTLTYTLTIPASEFQKFHPYLVGNAGIDVYVDYSIASLDIDIDSLYVDSVDIGYFAFVADGSVEFKDGKVLVSLTAALMDGVTKNDLVFYLYGDDGSYYGYDEPIAPKTSKDNGDGTITFTFEIDAETFDGFYGPASIDLYVDMGGGSQAVFYFDSLDIEFATAKGAGKFAYDSEKNVVAAELTVALMKGVSAEDLSFALVGANGTEDGIFEELSVKGTPTVNANGTVTFKFEIEASKFAGLLGTAKIYAFVTLGDEVAEILADSWDVDFAEAGSARFKTGVVTSEDNKQTNVVTATLTVSVMNGLNESNLAFVLRGYNGDLEWIEIDLSEYLVEAIDNKDGTFTFVFAIPEDVYSQLCGDVITVEDEDGDESEDEPVTMDLSKFQGIDIYVTLVEGSEEAEEDVWVLVEGWDHVFVEASDAE